MPKGLNIDHYGEYLYTLHLVRKARRRNDPAMAERWSRIAASLFNARRWGEEMDRAETRDQILFEYQRRADMPLSADGKRKLKEEFRRRLALIGCHGPSALRGLGWERVER